MWRNDEAPRYDRRAAVYDRLVRSRTYHRLLWGTRPGEHTAFAQRALEDGDGPLLDAGAGSAALTAALYRDTAREVVLADASQAMLDRAAARIGDAPHVRYAHGDVLAGDVGDGFGTVACFGVLHLVDDVPAWTARLRALGTGRVFVSVLVLGTHRVGRRYLRALHRAGEVAEPRDPDAWAALLAPRELEVRGSMAYAVL